MKKIQILGTGCPKCKQLTANVEEAVKQLGIDEALAARFPCGDELPKWTLARTPDGTSARP